MTVSDMASASKVAQRRLWGALFATRPGQPVVSVNTHDLRIALNALRHLEFITNPNQEETNQ